MSPRTKIVATLGPASVSDTTLRSMMAAGMDVARLNLSHGDLGGHLEAMGRVRAAASAARLQLAVLADLPGPKLRTGPMPAGGIELAGGAAVWLECGDEVCSSRCIQVEGQL